MNAGRPADSPLGFSLSDATLAPAPRAGYRTSPLHLVWSGLLPLARLHLLESWSPERLAREQVRQLRAVLAHAGRHVPHYREAFRRVGFCPRDLQTLDDLGRIPITGREEIAREPRSFLSDESGRRCVGNLSSVRTSGSSGSPLTVVLDSSEVAFSLSLVLYGWLRCGLRPGDTLAYLWAPSPYRPHGACARLPLIRERRIDLRQGEDMCLKELAALQPHVLYGYPSFLSLVAQAASRRGSPVFSPRVVITHGEILSEPVRDMLAQAFRCQVRDTYGSAEFNRLGFQCGHGSMHLIPTAAVVEVVRDRPAAAGLDGQCLAESSGEIVVTSLYHHTMPFVRYRLGDRAVISRRQCGCGCPFASLSRIDGRAEDWLTLPSGRRISPRAVCHLEHIPEIIEYRIVQRRRDLFEVFIRTDSPQGAALAAIRKTILEGCLGERVEVLVRAVESLPREPSGKARAVVSEIR